ncbi:Os11g0229600, partial [Oryza sativa Japonica Group]
GAQWPSPNTLSPATATAAAAPRRSRPLHRVQRRRPQVAPPRPHPRRGRRLRRRQRLEAGPLLALTQEPQLLQIPKRLNALRDIVQLWQ